MTLKRPRIRDLAHPTNPLHAVVKAAEIIALLGALVFVIMLFANQGNEATSPGGQLFSSNCASCHGANGEGGIGPRLAGEVTKDFPNIDDQIAVVTNGRGTMPSFKGDLSPEQIRLVVQYTRTGLGR